MFRATKGGYLGGLFSRIRCLCPAAEILDQGQRAQPRVSSLPVVKNRNVLENPLSHRWLIHRRLTMDPPILEAVGPTLRRGVIPAVSSAAHRTHHAIVPQKVLKHPGGILAPSIRVMDEIGRRLSAEPSHAQRIHRQVRRHPGLYRPAHHLPVDTDPSRWPGRASLRWSRDT